jgi:hypothetical protein
MESRRQRETSRPFRAFRNWLGEKLITREVRYIPSDAGLGIDLSGELDDDSFATLDDGWEIDPYGAVSNDGAFDSPIPGREQDLELLKKLHPPTLPPLGPDERVVKPGQ